MSAPILHVITNFAGPGGAEKMLARLINATPEQPTALVSLMTAPEWGSMMITRDDIEIKALGARNAAGMLRATHTLSGIIRDMRPAAIMSWMYHGNIAASVARRWSGHDTRLVWNVRHSLDDIASESRNTKAAIRLGRMLSGSPDSIIYAGTRAMEQHEAYGFAKGSGLALPNGYILPEETRPVPQTPQVFGTAARFYACKDYPTLTTAFGRIAAERSDARFRLAGLNVTDSNTELVAMLAECGISKDRYELVGQVSDIASFYRSIDVFCLSSISEGFPNVLAEAMSHGVPCVSTDVGDASLIVGDTGIIVPPQNPDALTAALLSVADPEGYPLRAAAARRRVEENFSMSTVTDRYMKVLRAAD